MSRLLELRPGCEAHASGALWIPANRALIVADAHLGYGWAQRRRGQLGPVNDGGARQKLETIISELRPEMLIFLGDLVHAPRPATAERLLVESTLSDLGARLSLLLVRGNHDRGFVRDYHSLGIPVVDHHDIAGLTAVHGDGPCRHAPFIAGHFHPAFGVTDDAGASQRIPVFLNGPNGVVLPAFSPLSAGYDIRGGLPPELSASIGHGPIEVIAATGRRVVRVGPVSGSKFLMQRSTNLNL